MSLKDIHYPEQNSKFPSAGLLYTIIVGVSLLLLPFQVWQGLFFATQTSKVLFLGWGVMVFGTIGGIYYFFTGGPGKFTFTVTDLALFLLLSFTVVHIVWIKPVQLHPLFILQWLSLGIMYIIFRRIEPNYRLLLMIFVMLAGAAQAIYGNLQLYGIYPSYHNLFKLTGSFFNPGPYSGYLVSIFPVAVGIYFMSVKHSIVSNCAASNPFFVSVFSFVKSVAVVLEGTNNKDIVNIRNRSNLTISAAIIRIIAIITIISVLLVLPAGCSRAAWLAAVLSTIFLFAAKGKISELWHQFVGTSRRKWLLYTLIIIAALAITSGLYRMKKNSADGRMLIWKVTINAIKEQPLLGHGIEKFKVFYMEGQADYFKGNPDSPETVVAGDNNYAFNEPLRIASETGLIGLALVLLVIWSVFGNGKSDKRKQVDTDDLFLLSRAGLLSVFIFGCFSYPAEIVSIMVNLILYLAIISGSQQPIFTMPVSAMHWNLFVRLIPAMALVAIAILASKQLDRINNDYTQWNEAYTTYSMGAYEDATDEYEKTYPLLKNNGDYLINYGKALSMAGKHEKAIEILERSKSFVNNTILYTALGDSYKATGQTSKAEIAYIHAWQMVPSRFYPKYLLAKLYDETGQHEKAVSTAKELLIKEVKIKSTAVKEIKEEMKKMIEKYW